MKKKFALLVLALGLTGCSNGEPYKDPEKVVEDSQVHSGVWLYQFESSTFLEDVSEVPTTEVDIANAAWLHFHPDEIAPGPEYGRYDVEQECYPTYAFAVSFVGRRTTYPDGPGGILRDLPGGGHLGLWGSDMSVEKMISAEALAGPTC